MSELLPDGTRWEPAPEPAESLNDLTIRKTLQYAGVDVTPPLEPPTRKPRAKRAAA